MFNIDETKHSREDMLLLFLTSVPGGFYGARHLQSGAFLISKNLPKLFEVNYEFVPGSYGPRDTAVYDDIDSLIKKNFAAKFYDIKGFVPFRYAAAYQGFDYAQTLEIPHASKDYIYRVGVWVLKQSFQSIIHSINTEYPSYEN